MSEFEIYVDKYGMRPPDKNKAENTPAPTPAPKPKPKTRRLTGDAWRAAHPNKCKNILAKSADNAKGSHGEITMLMTADMFDSATFALGDKIIVQQEFSIENVDFANRTINGFPISQLVCIVKKGGRQ